MFPRRSGVDGPMTHAMIFYRQCTLWPAKVEAPRGDDYQKRMAVSLYDTDFAVLSYLFLTDMQYTLSPENRGSGFTMSSPG